MVRNISQAAGVGNAVGPLASVAVSDIRQARRQGLERARQQRLAYHRRHNPDNPRKHLVTWLIFTVISASKSDTPHRIRKRAILSFVLLDVGT